MEQIKPALQGVKLLKTYRMGTRLYTAVTGCTPQPGVPTAVQVWYDPPAALAAGRLVTNDSDKEPSVTIDSEGVSSLRFTGELAGEKARFTVDSGATHSYPLPRIDDLLDSLNGACVFSGLDLAAGYWQIPIKDEDRHKTAFRTPMGLYEWNVMPFGLTNAPAVFARTMQTIFQDILGKFVLVYLDDILIFSKNPEEHEKHLEMVLQRLEQHKFYAQLKKCHFALPEIEFLGHMVSKEGICVDPRKVKIVQEWPKPANLSDLRSFLGLSNYFRRFVHAYSTIARPLHALTRKDVPWQWTVTCDKAF
jgi:hypothetical protein